MRATALALLTCSLIAPLQAQAPSGTSGQTPAPPRDARAEAVIQKHLRVRGGLAKLKAMKTLRIRGWRLLLPSEVGVPWALEQSRPNSFREELTLQGMVEVHTYNGTEGWIKIPWARERQAKAMSPEELAALKELDFDDPWIGALDHPEALSFQGTKYFNSVPCFVVRWTLDGNRDIEGYFDQEVGLEVMRDHVHHEMGMETKNRSEFQEWRTVKGIAFPYEVTHRLMGRGGRAKFTVETLEVDVALPDSRFGKP